MKARNQQHFPSELDAKEKLIVYVYEYLIHSGAKQAADTFKENIGYHKDIKVNEGPGFLLDWWCVFWDLYCAAPEKRNHPEPSNEARAFHEYNMHTVMSPQTSPPQPPPPHHSGPPFMSPLGMGNPRYGPPHHHPGPPMRSAGPPPMNIAPRMQTIGQSIPHHSPQIGGPPPPHMHPMMGGGPTSLRYASHPGMIPPGPNPPSSVSSESGPSPGLGNRMTPNHSSSPHSQQGGPQLGAMQISQVGPSSQMHQRVNAAMTTQGVSSGGGWQGNFNSNSPVDQQCFIPGPPAPSSQQSEFGGMIMNDGSNLVDVKPTQRSTAPNQQQDEYVMPSAYVQQADQNEGSEIMKLKESLESDTNDGEQSGFGLDFPDPQGKW